MNVSTDSHWRVQRKGHALHMEPGQEQSQPVQVDITIFSAFMPRASALHNHDY